MNYLRRAADWLLELPVIYRSLQAPFADGKLRPFMRRVDPGSLCTVLDVGCGPGTNTAVFSASGYVGVDINPDYVAAARSRFHGRFVVGDVTDNSVLPDDRFDCVFANSLMHHLPDESVDGLLARMAELVAPGGSVHVLDLILPDPPSPAWLLARLDRGRYPRSVPKWEALFDLHLEKRHLEVYPVGLPGLPLWWMLYFEGVPKS